MFTSFRVPKFQLTKTRVAGRAAARFKALRGSFDLILPSEHERELSLLGDGSNPISRPDLASALLSFRREITTLLFSRFPKEQRRDTSKSQFRDAIAQSRRRSRHFFNGVSRILIQQENFVPSVIPGRSILPLDTGCVPQFIQLKVLQH